MIRKTVRGLREVTPDLPKSHLRCEFEGDICPGSDSLLISKDRTNKNSSDVSGSFNYNLFHDWFLT